MSYRNAPNVKPEELQPFPLEKILTVSARNYCESVGKNLSDYIMRGVHARNFSGRPSPHESEQPSVYKVPREAECVVGYSAGNDHYFQGTALVPKIR